MALEPKDGLLRVELALTHAPGERRRDLPLAHGLTGQIEIEVEETSPLALLLRAAGRQTEALGTRGGVVDGAGEP